MFLLFILLAIGGASLLAAYSFGRFAKGAKGATSYSLPIHDQQTPIDSALKPLLSQHPDQSCLRLMTDNLEAFAIRAMLAREAGRSLDLQYYIWHDDLTGKLLAYELLQAADRGVRVRLLLDDMNACNKSRRLATLNQHPNIEVRLFNPTRIRSNLLLRGIEMTLRWLSVNRRMHNKAWIVDGRLAVIGGRNIGDEYFDAAEHRNFFDVDLLVGGQAVAEASTIFDCFWNCNAVIPIRALFSAKPKTLKRLRQQVAKQRTKSDAQPYLSKLHTIPDIKSLLAQGNIYWSSRVHVYSDPPNKVFGEEKDRWLIKDIRPTIHAARKQLAVISPYFVPGTIGVNTFCRLKDFGVEVSVLTNSLVANDVIMAHGGYAPYRKVLLKKGITLYELKPFKRAEQSLLGSNGASLHTKAFLVDQRIGFVGSLNFDPRSMMLNTEMGILFEEPEIAQALMHEFNLRSSRQFSYQVVLKEGHLRWQDCDHRGNVVMWQYDPHSRWWQRWLTKLVGWLPIQSQL